MKMNRIATMALVLLTMDYTVQAQGLVAGTIVGTAQSNSQVCFVQPGLSPQLLTTTLGFYPGSIIEDPGATVPGTSFLVAGNPFGGAWFSLSRLTFTYSAALSAYTWSIASLVSGGPYSNPVRMAMEPSGTSVIVFDRTSDSIVRVTLSSASATVGVVYAGTTSNWGSSLSCGTVDPASGDILVAGGSPASVWRLPSTATQAFTPILLFSSIASSIAEISIDPLNFNYLLVASSGQVLKYNLSSPSAPPLSYVSGGALGNRTIVAMKSNAVGDTVLLTRSTVSPYLHEFLTAPNSQGMPPAGGVALGSSTASCGIGNLYADFAITGSSSVPFQLYVTPNTLGPGSAQIQASVPPQIATGASLLSGVTSFPVGSGPFIGLYMDGLFLSTLQYLYSPPVAGSPLRWITGASGVWPSVPLNLPAGSFPVGTTLDFELIGFSLTGSYMGHSNIVRASW